MTTPTVYIIDDQQVVRDALAEMLRLFGYTVETLPSADAFLELISAARPGCIVADVRMPGRDGIELVRELARRQVSLPVVLISGHGRWQHRSRRCWGSALADNQHERRSPGAPRRSPLRGPISGRGTDQRLARSKRTAA